MAKILGLQFGKDDHRGYFCETRSGVNIFSFGGGHWKNHIHEPFTGAWQRNMEIRRDIALDNFAIYTCVSRIASDIAKCPAIIKHKDDEGGVLSTVEVPRYSSVLRRPNHYQNWAQFCESWLMSKLLFGNSFVLKERDQNGRVSKLHVLNPDRIRIEVTPDGSVWYKYKFSKLDGGSSGHNDVSDYVFSSYDIVHDRCSVTLPETPLIGISPLAACLLAAGMGSQALHHSSRLFFAGRPGGILQVPKAVTKEQAEELKRHYNSNMFGDGASGLLVISDGMTFNPLGATAQDSMAKDSIHLSADIVCAAYGVPKYFVLGTDPTGGNIEAEQMRYFSMCLQTHIEKIEHHLDEALEVDIHTYSIELDTTNLMRMDTTSRWSAHKVAISCGAKTPNEVRREEGLRPVEGGDQCYMQQQNFPLSDMAKRSLLDNPFSNSQGVSSITMPPANDNQEQEE